MSPRAVFDDLAIELSRHFGDRFTSNPATCLQHCHSLTLLEAQPPDGVIHLRTREEVIQATNLCRSHQTPIIPFGGGTSLEGQVNAPLGGIAFDFTNMSSVLGIDEVNLSATVEAGITLEELNSELEPLGLFFPVNPGANATLGGMASTRASGTNAVKYGTMRENTLGLEIVLADGSVIEVGTAAKKSSAGYDLVKLFIGAEGTLGLITKLTLKLAHLPESIGGGRCSFQTIESATRAVIEAVKSGIDFARIELLDEIAIRACNAYSSLDLEEKPTLFVELHGSTASVAEQKAKAHEIFRRFGGSNLDFADDDDERLAIWAVRRDAWWAIHELYPGLVGVTTDVCVPMSALSECIHQAKVDLVAYGLNGPIVGHVGDGNFHVLLMLDLDDRDELTRADRFMADLCRRALALGGTSTGEHGVGQGKARYMSAEHGSALAVMKQIKTTLDPMNIMNPLKIFESLE